LKEPTVKADVHRMGRITRGLQRWRRSTRHEADSRSLEPDDAPSSRELDDLQASLLEATHERDVSIARASEAEERARLADDRLRSLASLEHRVEVAERRALDAERRLEEISERVNAASAPPDAPTPSPEATSDPPDATAELRARLARAAERKRHREPE